MQIKPVSFIASVTKRYLYVIIGLIMLLLFAFNNIISIPLFIIFLYFIAFLSLPDDSKYLLYFFILTVPFIGLGIGINTSKGLLLTIPFVLAKYYRNILNSFNLIKNKYDPISIGIFLMAISFIITMVNTLIAGNINNSVINQTGQIIFEVLILTLVINAIRDMHSLDKILTILKIPTLVFSIAIIAYLVYNGFDYLFSIKHIVLLGADINANLVAMMLTPLVMLLFADRRFNKPIVSNPLYYILMIVCLSAIVITNSRGAWVGLLCASTYMIIRTNKIKMAIVVMIMVILVALIAGDAVSRRYSQTNIQEQGIIIRFLLWHVAINYMIINPLLGLGPDMFRIEKTRLGFLSLWDQENILSSHNMYLEIGVNFGVMALIGFIMVSIYLLQKIDRMSRGVHTVQYKQYLLAVNSAIIVILVHGFFDCGIASSGIAFVIFLIFGLAILIVRKPGILNDNNIISQNMVP